MKSKAYYILMLVWFVLFLLWQSTESFSQITPPKGVRIVDPSTPPATGNILEQLGADFVAHFDDAITVDQPANLSCERYGGRIIPGGISEGALSLGVGEYLVVNQDTILSLWDGRAAERIAEVFVQENRVRSRKY